MVLPDKLEVMLADTEIEFISYEPLELNNMQCSGILIQLRVEPVHNSIRLSCGKYKTLTKIYGGSAYVWVWNKPEESEENRIKRHMQALEKTSRFTGLEI